MFTPFDLLNSPLEGTRLIEASAGTGKTYALSGLVLRLILEKNLSIKEILVVTFTEAATQELKDRIRHRLREGLEVLDGHPGKDPFLDRLMVRQAHPEISRMSLGEALRAFDQAAIFTIHGFCRRILHENAFESGSLFDTDLMPDQSGLKQQIVEDFWRRQFYGASPLFMHYIAGGNWGMDTFIALLDRGLVQPEVNIIPEQGIFDATEAESAFQDAFDRLRDAWPSAKGEVESIFMNDEGLNRQKYGRAKIPTWIRGMDHYVAMGRGNPHLFKGFAYFTSGMIRQSVKKRFTAPGHPFFDICQSLNECREALVRVYDHNLTGIKVAFFRYVREELRRRKKARNIQSFDDLLLRVRDALRKKGGRQLRQAIRAKFMAALIDEFQDTDPVQYDIFKSIFEVEKRILFFIGDPKQAI
ncbi:MAG: UvrD-helicase domain-containing protein, partial [Deltaproteobacteria bacterium]|nr:UvrD-helicase domain-containing protein [Deltaproteobacteria bacterium]